MRIKAVRENLKSGRRWNAEIQVEMFTTDIGELYFKVTKGGITGGESLPLYVFSNRPDIVEKGWVVSAGIKGKEDRLTIPPCQLDKLLGEVGL